MIITAVEMPDWDVRQHRMTLIRFDGRTWRVAGKSTDAGKVRYELAPWTPAEEYVIGRDIEYGDAYVAARDQHRVSSRRSGRVTLLLRIVSPLVGFLPARVKGRFETLYGLDPVAVTFQSVFLEFLISIGSFTLLAIGQMVKGLAGVDPAWSAWLLFAIGLVVAIDGSMRYSRILREERPPVGFLEWLLR